MKADALRQVCVAEGNDPEQCAARADEAARRCVGSRRAAALPRCSICPGMDGKNEDDGVRKAGCSRTVAQWEQ